MGKPRKDNEKLLAMLIIETIKIFADGVRALHIRNCVVLGTFRDGGLLIAFRVEKQDYLLSKTNRIENDSNIRIAEERKQLFYIFF